MRCIHHFDADGYGAAAIVNTELRSVFDTVTSDHFIEYNHNGIVNIKDEETFFKENDTLYIVDLALDQTIFDTIKKAITAGMKIVHIDHHISGDKFYQALSTEDKAMFDEHVVRFFTTQYSGCMLTWVYACMNDEERQDPMNVPFDLSPDLGQVAFYPDTDNIRVVGIPLAIRMIDDNDVWRHSLPESKFFASAWTIQDKDTRHPLNMEFWNELLYEGPRRAYDIIDQGELIYKYQENMYKSVMYNAFEVTIGDYHGIAVNCPTGNSRLFGEAFEKYDFVCKFSQTKPNEWRYTFYSREGGADCEKLVKQYFNDLGLCGGHVHASAGTITKNLFDNCTEIY